MWKQIAGGVAALIMVTGCTAADEAAAQSTLPAEVTPDEAATLASERGVVLIDVRRASEWAETGVAEGAHRITLQDADFAEKVAAILGENKNAEVAFICRSGGRSATARDQIIAAGYSNATSVAGGTLGETGWIASGLPVYDVE